MSKKVNFIGDTALLLYLAGLKLLIHLAVNFTGGYGIFRDEFYYLACAAHPAWGYVDQPPFSIIVLAAWKFIFGDSLFAIRLLPALLGAAVVFLTGKMVQQMGGKRFAQVLAALAVIVAPQYLALHGFYSMNVFDHLAWTGLIYILIRIIKTNHSKLWLLFGVIAGLGLQNKISVLFLAFGLGIALLLTQHRRRLLDKYLWYGVGLAVLIFLPHIIWQIQNGWPTLEFMAYASKYKNVHLPPLQFFIEQVLGMNPATVLLWLGGLFYLLFGKALKSYRLFAIAYIAIFLLFIFQSAKPYYLSPIYPILFAAGAMLFETVFSKRFLGWLRPATMGLFVAGGIFSAPLALPILPVEKYIAFAQRTGFAQKAEEHQEMGLLPQHFADMQGWEEMAADIAQVYHALPDSEQAEAAIYTQNYGEAGAVDYYREKYNLPPAICGHNNYYLWGTRGRSCRVLIIFGGKREDHLHVFESVTEEARFENPYVMPYENHRPIYLCRYPKLPFSQVWVHVKHFG
jgi:hypothetical protein